jgi:endoglucanase
VTTIPSRPILTTITILVLCCVLLPACDASRVRATGAVGGSGPATTAASSAGTSAPSWPIVSGRASQPKITAAPNGPVPIAGLHVQGNEIVNKSGVPVRLRGFNQSGAEYACVEGWGIFDVPPNDSMPAVVIQAMSRWTGANAVRVPLNEQCWLGFGVMARYGGQAYQSAIASYVNLLTAAGFAVILDLHRSAPSSQRSLDQEQMPDRDHSVEFWRQVAVAFGSNHAVLFDLFNEPAPFDGADSERAWQCWRDGGCTLRSKNGDTPYLAAGMNELIAAVRSAGARNIVIVGGINWAENLDGWLRYRPTDPLNNVVAAFHAYSFNTQCASVKCYDTVLSDLAQQVPIFAGEVGPDLTVGYDKVRDKCAQSAIGDTGFDDALFDWLDAHNASFTAWSWNDWTSCWALISDWSGTPTKVWGRYLKARLAYDTPATGQP